jgi:hypothetical protein
MICVAALIVFAILALFSAKYRPLAKEAFQCVFLKLRLRPCNSGLDRRVRVAAMMPFMRRTPRVAKAIYKYFPVLSALFVALTAASFVWLAWGGYNYALYGNCNGPGSSGFCVFDPSGPGVSDTGQCTEVPHDPSALIKPTNLSGFKTIHPTANFTVIFFGCYSCPYTREAAPALLETIAAHPDVRFVLIDFPIATHNGSEEAATAANCVYDISPDQYLSYADLLYKNLSAASSVDISACIEHPHPRVALGKQTGLAAGVYGTPTYFIGDKAVVGPLNRRSLEKLIRDNR